MKNAQKFKFTDVQRQNGETARLKVIHGPDAGALYVILGNSASIGRGEDCDVIISDLKASRLHAQVSRSSGGWQIQDLGSSNGILHNGKATRSERLILNDTFTVGETLFEFTSSDVGTMMLVAPPRSFAQVQAEQKQMEEHHQKMASMGMNGPGAAGNSRVLIYGVAIAILAFLLFSGGEKPVRQSKPVKREDSRDLASYLPKGNPEVNRAADTLFKDGLREYLDGNYNRARTQFETVLQISPGHPLATIYTENCDIAIKNEVTRHLENGKKAFTAGKLRDARAHYERIVRLLYRDQSNPGFIEAKDQLEKVTAALRDGGSP